MKTEPLWILTQLILCSQGQFVLIVLETSVYINNSDIFITEIGEGTAALACQTSQSGCCKGSAAGDWYYPDGRAVGLRSSGDDFYRNRDDSGKVYLHRRNNARTPRGVYYCLIPDHFGVMKRLQVGLYLPEDYPSVTKHPASLSEVTLGSNVSFSVEAMHVTKYNWYFNEFPIRHSSPRHTGVLSSTLTILNVTSEDEGTYQCVITSQFHAVSSNQAELTLIGPPTLVIHAEDALNVLPGSTVSFIVFSFDLSASYLWIRQDGRPINSTDERFMGISSRNLTITDIRQSDAGTYICVVSNSGGSTRSMATLSLKILPPILVTPARDSLDVTLGSNVTFSVFATGYSLLYLWELGNGESLPTSDSRFIGVRSSKLTITDIRTSDAGTYVCKVSNTGGSVRSTAQLTILLKAPVIEREAEDQMNVEVGTNVTFSVSASGYSLEYIWKQGNELSSLPPDPRISGSRSYQLTISNVQHSDAGLYVCVVSNSAGAARSSAILSLGLGPSTIESLSVVPSTSSALISWTVDNTTNDSLLYEVEYHPVLFPSFSFSLSTSATSLTLDGLIPQLQYVIRVRFFNQSTWEQTEVIQNEKIPSVEMFSAELINGSEVYLSWRPVDISGWNISYYYLIYSASSPSEDARPFSRKFVLEGSSDSKILSPDLLVMKPGMVHVFELSAVLSVENLEGLGEVQGTAATFNMTFDYEMIPFQVMLGPVDYCINWGKEKADRIRRIVRNSITKAVSSRCNCSFADKNIGKDFFSCRASKTTVIYRSSIVGYFGDIFVEYIRHWVLSDETMLLDWFIVDIYNSCPVKLFSVHDMDCRADSGI